MKYFVTKEKIANLSYTDYIELRALGQSDKNGQNCSLYMTNDVINETEFVRLLGDCMYRGIVFDMSLITLSELSQVLDVAFEYGRKAFEAVNELMDFLNEACNSDEAAVDIIFASDREADRRREMCASYNVDTEFYEEVMQMQEKYKDLPVEEYFSVTQPEYEALLRKYNMPECFFPTNLYDDEN